MTRTQQRTVFSIILMVLLSATVILTLTFLLTSAIFQRLGQQPSPFVAQIINSALGLVFCFLILSAIGRLVGSKQRNARIGIFVPIMEAMGQIARGDFSVRLDTENEHYQDNEIMTELAKSVNNMALELNTMEAMRQEFISNVSHEIQSPLTSIRGFAQALQNDHLSLEDKHHYLTIIETESTRLSKLTDNLLKLASLESDQVKFEPKPYRLDRQIRNLILLCEPQWTTKALAMEVSLEEIDITADEDLLSQVWINLLHNSIKFTPHGGSICVDLHRCEDKIEFKITDTGIGINEADQVRVFERFYKADKARERSRSKEGSGLGLSIAQKIIEMHHGSIALESRLGAGTTFTVSLPAQQPQPDSPLTSATAKIRS